MLAPSQKLILLTLYILAESLTPCFKFPPVCMCVNPPSVYYGKTVRWVMMLHVARDRNFIARPLVLETFIVIVTWLRLPTYVSLEIVLLHNAGQKSAQNMELKRNLSPMP